ncbi:MAG: hypothetical protein ACU0CO_07250 [Shimia sp.]
MSKHITLVLAFGLVGLTAACGGRAVDDGAAEDFVIVEIPAPLTSEPVFTGKFK